MQRLRAYDVVTGGLPDAVGCCPSDLPRLFGYINSSQERLNYDPAANEEGWSGGWSEISFLVNRKTPVITCPRGVERLEGIDVCTRPVPLRNQFYEYLQFGNGRFPKSERWGPLCRNWGSEMGLTRNYACTFEDLTNGPQQIQIFAVDSSDTQANSQTGAIPRVLLQGIVNGMPMEEYVTLAQPYAISENAYTQLTGIQKDITQGQVTFFQSDPTWGVAEQRLVMEPSETTAWYRRYYLHGLPPGCCAGFRPVRVNPKPETCNCPYPPTEHVYVTALAKHALIPVMALTDYCLLQSKEAIILGSQAVRFSRMDDAASTQKSRDYHAQAIRILAGQGIARDGKNSVAVNYAPFGRRGGRMANLCMK